MSLAHLLHHKYPVVGLAAIQHRQRLFDMKMIILALMDIALREFNSADCMLERNFNTHSANFISVSVCLVTKPAMDNHGRSRPNWRMLGLMPKRLWWEAPTHGSLQMVSSTQWHSSPMKTASNRRVLIYQRQFECNHQPRPNATWHIYFISAIPISHSTLLRQLNYHFHTF